MTNGQEVQFDASGRLRSTRYEDVYFSGDGVAESRHVFLHGNELPARFEANRGTFVVGETGFGTGLNFLAAATEFLDRSRDPASRLVYVSTERHVLDAATLERVHAGLPTEWTELAQKTRSALAATGPECSFVRKNITPRITLVVLLGDARQTLSAWSFFADAWFLDGFAPARNPDLWSTGVFEAVAARTAPEGTFATFSVAGTVRRGLAACGFEIERAPGFGRKREMLRGRLRTRRPSPAPWAVSYTHLTLPTIYSV